MPSAVLPVLSEAFLVAFLQLILVLLCLRILSWFILRVSVWQLFFFFFYWYHLPLCRELVINLQFHTQTHTRTPLVNVRFEIVHVLSDTQEDDCKRWIACQSHTICLAFGSMSEFHFCLLSQYFPPSGKSSSPSPMAEFFIHFIYVQPWFVWGNLGFEDSSFVRVCNAFPQLKFFLQGAKSSDASKFTSG